MGSGGFQRFCSSRMYVGIGLVLVVLVGLIFSSQVASFGRTGLNSVATAGNFFLVRSATLPDVLTFEKYVAATGGVSNEKNSSVVVANDRTAGRSGMDTSNTTSADLTASTRTSSKALEECPVVPPNLVTRMKVVTNPPPIEEQEKIFAHLMPGGRYTPQECHSRHRVAIIIPYRNRTEHLVVFLNHMHYMLKRQQLDYGIYVVEQAGNDPFNRGKLLNIGYLIASRLYDYQCFIFHDVDMIPEDDRNLYTCSDQPRHMTVAVSKFNYKLPYHGYFGGGCALSKEQVENINGFSNEYWGWGAEDDDLGYRVLHHKYNITRYSSDIARYTTLWHKQAEASPARMKLLNERQKRFKTDGINSAKYTIRDIVFRKLYTWILADLRYKKPLSS